MKKLYRLLSHVIVMGMVGVVIFLFSWSRDNVSGDAVLNPLHRAGKVTAASMLGEDRLLFSAARHGRGRHAIEYMLYAPAKPYPPGVRFPLVVVLHDTDGDATAARRLARAPLRDEFPAFILAPMAPGDKLWSFPSRLPEAPALEANIKRGQVLDSVMEAIADILRRGEPVDPRRLYIVGCGEGGFGVLGAARDYDNAFAGGIAVNAGWSKAEAPLLDGFPLWLISGARDRRVPPILAVNVGQALTQRGVTVRQNVFPSRGGDCADPLYYPHAAWQWLFGLERKDG